MCGKARVNALRVEGVFLPLCFARVKAKPSAAQQPGCLPPGFQGLEQAGEAAALRGRMAGGLRLLRGALGVRGDPHLGGAVALCGALLLCGALPALAAGERRTGGRAGAAAGAPLALTPRPTSPLHRHSANAGLPEGHCCCQGRVMQGQRGRLPAGLGGQPQSGSQPPASPLFIPYPRKAHTLLCVCSGVHAFSPFFSLPKGPAQAPTPVPPFRRVDIALGCSYLGEDAGGSPRASGGSSSKHPATLVLRSVSVRDDGNLDDVTEYKAPQKKPDSSSPVVFEASGEWESWGGRPATGVLAAFLYCVSTRFFFD